jgi:hypothetical protein
MISLIRSRPYSILSILKAFTATGCLLPVLKKNMQYVVHTSGSCGIAVVKFKKRLQKLVEIAREYTVPYRDRLFVPSVKTNHVICCAYIGVLWYRGN